MTHDELVALFKPDKYGFCQKHKVWFDVVVKINEAIKENS